MTASECHSPHGVGFQMLFTESITALAADAADDEPRASITAAPRFCTVSMNLPLSHPWSLITSKGERPAIFALRASGYCVVEWLPQTPRFLTTPTGTPAFLASSVLARFSSSRVMANQRSGSISGALDRAIRQLVLHGLP